MQAKQTRLTITQILAWADAHHRRRAKWPSIRSGPVLGGSGTTWSQINSGLQQGYRGLAGGSSLAQLLAKKRGKRNPKGLPRLTVNQILKWVDEHHRRTGKWPRQHTGPLHKAAGEDWLKIDTYLRRGLRGLRGGSSLARLLDKHRGVRNQMHQPPVTIQQILTWADAHYAQTGEWPTAQSGRVHRVSEETWQCIDHALRFGRRGLPRGWRLTRLLARHRNRPYRPKGPPITEAQILAWAKAHHKRTSEWPRLTSGRISGGHGETWTRVDMALRKGSRGLAGGSSLSRLLAKHYGLPNRAKRRKRPATRRGQSSKPRGPRLTETQIVVWAKAHYKRTGRWPASTSGPIREGRNETWTAINSALDRGSRGLAGGTSLARLLAQRCGKRHRLHQPPLTMKRILAWADAHHRRTGDWPSRQSGPLPEAPGENWSKINVALLDGRRGLRGGSPLERHLAIHRGRPYHPWGPPLTEAQIVKWARAHRQRTGRWPHRFSGPVPQVLGEHWQKIDMALALGCRGLPGGSSLIRLFAKRCGVRHPHHPPPLTIKKILAWADAYYQRTGDWPSRTSGPVPEAPGETWSIIAKAMSEARRGLLGASSLVRLFSKHRRTLYQRKGMPLKRSQILNWAAAHHELTGKLPTKKSGPVRGEPGELWSAIDAALRAGSRSLRGRSSLAEFLNKYYARPYQGIGQRLTVREILKWADDFHQRVGRWPTKTSAYTSPARQERWSTIDLALRQGHRGLPAGSSLHKLLTQHRSNR
ncbi:MAG: hypothetical protein IH983_02785 [Planctomycetes bacterium]|nr:hypothetical protein [Planctomycetota bacterium]